ncbi:TPA: alpha/beta hydrolase [Staphylococcus aureus]|nr:alpha/beta hydrolase [Staphylococcus aureus]HCD3339435.1 alpha/beta hydrolase [Staphylococcus aureus]
MEGIRSLLISDFTKKSQRMEFLVHYNKAMRFLPRARTIYDVETTFGMVRVYYYASKGSEGKVPLILLHGHYASTIMWQPNLLPLSERAPVYSVDLLGEPGRSRLKKPLWKEKDHAAWLKEVMVKLEISSAILLGSSMGGYYAVNFARYYPEKTEGLILLDPVFVFSGNQLILFLAAFDKGLH